MKKHYFILLLFLGLHCGSYAQEPLLGEVRIFAGNFAPRGWAFCDGQLLSIAQNTALFSLLGTTYGGDGRTTFALPDLRGRAAVGTGTGPGISPVSQGQRSGTESYTITTNALPGHTHPMYGVSETGTAASPQSAYPAGTMRFDPEYTSSGTTVLMNSGVIGTNSSTTQAVENRQPSLGVNYIIALVGIYPSRS